MQRRICVINDISCEGRCSVTAALPIYAAGGIHPNVIPTALLSTQTGGYSGYSYLDLSGEIIKIAKHFKELGLKFDVVYTGYLASERQIELVMEAVSLLDTKTLIVDPVMGDEGRLYDGFDASYCEAMKKLCARADIIVPNLTEACLLAGREYGRKSGEEIEELAEALSSLCRGRAVITGIKRRCCDDCGMCIGIGIYHKGILETEFYPEENEVFHGAGDVFGAALSCGIAYGKDLAYAAKFAHKFTREAISKTKEYRGDTRQGLCFEPCLKMLAEEYNK